MEEKVVQIVDRDTLVVRDDDKTPHRVRLAGIDTPEQGQPFGKQAKENLSRLAADQDARVEFYNRDRWNRLIVKVWVQSPDSSCQAES